ncbi:hypothetical protein [Streptomyces sp. WM6378]|uniref:hypothetical protein n=1 Tax=Streptomyces sp. WM6378 TaxID=1415557 RepID=UPI0006AF802A|nr:hypothetical protein [Streptomyces sp. WM6378]KOU33754.1 hypothetical protein ADK54_41655 [Streptomyces sp. WM6378]
MGVLYGYFAAADDDDAVRAVVREDGEPIATGYDGFDGNGVDPVISLLPAEVLLTGRAVEVVEADARRGHVVAMIDEGEVLCLSLTDSLRDALASTDRASLHGVARDWAASDVFDTPPDPDDIVGFLNQAADLADGAIEWGYRLYCWVCV